MNLSNAPTIHVIFSLRCKKLHTIFGEGWSGQQVLQDLAILLKRTLHFLPGHELTHLFGQFPEFLKLKPKRGDTG